MFEVSSRGEQFWPWTVIPNLSGNFELLKLIENASGLDILLRNESGRLLQIRDADMLGYRVTSRDLDETFWLQFEEFSASFGSFWRIEKSVWLQSISARENSLSPLAHYFIATETNSIEIISPSAPSVSWVDNFFGDAH